MSISGALSSALSGLTAASRSAEVVSSNIANALTEGYARREISLSARTTGTSGQGVTVTGVLRTTNLPLTNDRRLAQASVEEQRVKSQFFLSLERVIGTPGIDGSLGQRISRFEGALLEAASAPASESRLVNVLQSAKSLTEAFHSISNEIQTSRSLADKEISGQVDAVNSSLARISSLNGQIRSGVGNGRDVSALMDQRQKEIDSIAKIIPLREANREGGQIALFTASGAVLLDGKPSILEFTRTDTIVPEMTVESGGLSGLKLNGVAITATGEGSKIAGGSLSALFTIRDTDTVQEQMNLDAVARDLVERFSSGVDPTLNAGQAGLFTDGETLQLPVNETGLSGRLSLNPSVDPDQNGAIWKLRDGLGATAPGQTGGSSILTAMSQALTSARSPVSGGFSDSARSFSTFATDFLSLVANKRTSAEAETSYAASRFTALKEMELQMGVDTDQELQSLLMIEQSYAANAKVIRAIDEMIQALVGM